MFSIKSLFYFLSVGLGIIFILAISSVSIFAADKPEIFVQMGHSDSINNVLFTSDGNYLVSGSRDGSIKIWEVASGKEIRTLRHSDKISAIAIAPDNQKILSGDEKGNIILWDWQTGQSVGKFVSKSAGEVTSLSFSSDGKRAISTNVGSLTYWDVTTKKQVFSLIRYGIGSSKSTIFLSDSNYIVMGVDVENSQFKPQAVNIEIYDVTKRKTVKTFSILKGDTRINSLVVSPDKKYFLVSVIILKDGSFFNSTGKLFVVDAGNGNIIKELSFADTSEDISFSPNGHYAAAATNGEVTVFDTKTWDIVKKMGKILPLAFSPDSKFLVCNDRFEQTYYGESIVREGLEIIDLKSWNKIRRFSGNVDFVTSSMFSSEDREILTSYYLLNYWDREKGILRKSQILKDSWDRKVSPARGNAFSADGTYAIVCNVGFDNGSYIYNLKSNKLRKIIDKPLAHVDFASDNKTMLFSTYDNKVILWDVENNINIRTFADWGNRKTLSIEFHQLSSDGKYATTVYYDTEKEGSQNVIIVWDVLTGREVNRIEITNYIYSFILSPDGKYILTGEFNASEDDHFIALRGLTNDRVIRKLQGHKGMISSLSFSHDGKFILSGSWDQKAILWETESGNKIKTFAGHSGIIRSISFSLNDQNFISSSTDGTTRLWNISTGKEIAQFISFTDGEWIVITPEGYFNASPGGAKHLNVRVGNNVYSIDNFYEKFFNPVYVASVLQGKKVEAFADIRKGILSPPDVRITSPAPGKEFSTDTLTVSVAARDTGGGIDGIRLYHNGKAIGEDQRGLKLISKGGETVKDYNVTLVDGANTFRAVGFSKDRTESNPYELVVNLTAPSKDVSLYVFAVGINNYKNPALNLNYAEPDALGIADFFKGQGKGLFKNLDVTAIYNEQATKQNIVSKLSQMQNINPQDAALIYLAGHGENINDKWYFIPYELTYPEREEDVKAKGISSDELSGYIKNIKAQKILLLIDACKAGAVLIAFRGFEDRKALSQLSRSTGVHIVAASTKDQFAAEVKDLGHGVFTYTLLQGLGGKAAGNGDSVTVRKLMGYVEENLPEITKKYKQEAQYPVVDSRGMDFPLVILK
jgi:WD40 repeat protein